MKILSLFDGISCARVALERAGIPVEVYYASEVDKYAIQVAQKNYPDTIQLGGVESVTAQSVGGTDLLIGGSPCQDLSIAKANRQGLAGNRSGLFWEYVRILQEVRPTWFVLENVASMPKEAKALITETLGVEPIMIDAALVSAQRRKRLFWVGERQAEGKYSTVNILQPKDREIFLNDILECGVGEPVALRNRGSGKKPEYNNTGKANALTTVQTDSMVDVDVDSVYQYRRTYWRETKGGKVPTLTANMGTGGHNVPFVLQSDGTLKVREATKAGYAIAKDGDAVDLSYPSSKTRRGRVGNKAKNLMTSSMGIHAFTQGTLRKLTVTECERLQSLPDGYTEGVSNTQRYKALGNAFNVEVVAHILRHIPR
jgi:DNA (cytosine-5)-methyltransferase 3A